MSRKRIEISMCDPLESAISSSDDDNKRHKSTEEHSCMKYYKRLDKKMDLLQRNMDVKFNYMELLLQKILKTQNHETSFSSLQMDFCNSSPSQSTSQFPSQSQSQSPSPVIKKERIVSL